MVWKELERQEARRGRSRAEPIGTDTRLFSMRETLIAAIFGARAPAPEHEILAVCSAHWPAIVGDLAQRCRPTKVSGGRLTIECEHAVFAQELQFQVSDLIRRIQELPGGSAVVSLQIRARQSENHARA